MFRKSSLVSACLLIAAHVAPAAAQHRVYYTPLRPESASPFQVPSTADLGRTLSSTQLAPATPVSTPALAVVDSAAAPRLTCPMPIVVSDSTRLEAMPVEPVDSAHHQPMPVLKPRCVNPLRP